MSSNASVIPPTPSADQYDATGDRPLIEAADDPIALFTHWLSAAMASEPNDANAMTLSTVDAAGYPDARILLLKDVTAAGFTF
ncbi:MAG: pyridoxamine 5'-phosphate oxidase family protein, partial [Pseudomonadota bacterium]